MIEIAVINKATVVTDADAVAWTKAIQKQVKNDWAPAWGVPAQLDFIGAGKTPPAAAWWIAITDNADQAGALGYHDVTTAGLPLGKVFAKTTLDAGDLVSVTLSHEILEMLGDPDVNLLVQKGTRFYAYEVCDAVEDDSLGYDVGNVRVSDFVYPAYFETFQKAGSKQFDHKKRLTQPLPALTRGGYLAYLQNGQWHQTTMRSEESGTLSAKALRAEFKARPRLGSRRQRRAMPPGTWTRSIVETT